MDYSGLTENDLRECFAKGSTKNPILLFNEDQERNRVLNYSIFLNGETVIMDRGDCKYEFRYNYFNRSYLNEKYYPIAFERFMKYLRLRKVKMMEVIC
jgi:hypothetical protein